MGFIDEVKKDIEKLKTKQKEREDAKRESQIRELATLKEKRITTQKDFMIRTSIEKEKKLIDKYKPKSLFSEFSMPSYNPSKEQGYTLNLGDRRKKKKSESWVYGRL